MNTNLCIVNVKSSFKSCKIHGWDQTQCFFHVQIIKSRTVPRRSGKEILKQSWKVFCHDYVFSCLLISPRLLIPGLPQ